MAKEASKYEDGQIITKDVTDLQGKKDNVNLPEWMKKDAKLPDHVKDLKCQKIELPYAYSRGRWVVLIRDVLNKEECEELIKFSEEQGYEDALVNIGYGRQQKMPNFRNCQRMMIDNFDMADCLWTRLTPFIPTYFNDFKKIAFNERLRFLRYNKKEFFGPHFDGTYQRPNGEFSQITLLLYLNANFKGANTNFLDMNDDDNYHAPKITPGMVIMFQHDIFHEGAMLEEGTKYIVRTDVMYTKRMYSKEEMEKDPDNIEIQYIKYDGIDHDDKDQDDKNNKNEDDEKDPKDDDK
mmetsp:Transcript_28600/g.25258  ORF Transcript_28600/g.25258 Transcript_28600/m.25258 type:complete len:294 (+) Transcript_28600:233-1114(+)|eukprot:CAMPEP_0201578594 /NCGR_PEP_ID=MMETSP0190_2-20130828/25536_1 /ASSEMBLY_ACC=CAM_ASM_000263 /TAXON_ID=37353 /ORGANISM="Rosalina sp." /LENGTH=293 /DNA_ID=CAMNT_0048011939 /DNA_START=67 /DNA_END=951 /DNA_ORIENTATION=-